MGNHTLTRHACVKAHLKARQAEISKPQPEKQNDQTNDSVSDEDDDDDLDGTIVAVSDGKFQLNLGFIGRNNEIDDDDDDDENDDSEFVFRLVKLSIFCIV